MNTLNSSFRLALFPRKSPAGWFWLRRFRRRVMSDDTVLLEVEGLGKFSRKRSCRQDGHLDRRASSSVYGETVECQRCGRQAYESHY